MLGPGIIAGAADNDPTTVGTLSVVGSSTGYSLAWLILLLAPMLIAVQLMSSSLGLVARRGLETVIRETYGPRWAMLTMVLVLGVNLVTIAADLEGGAAALGLLTGLDWRYFVLPLALVAGAVLLLGTYRFLERYLTAILFLFLAYLGAAVAAGPDWGAVLRSTLVPTIQPSREYVSSALALLGTTLTSYVYFWQTIEEEEERPPLRYLPLARAEAAVGVTYAVIIFWSILVATGSTLTGLGRPVQTAEEAAQALAPIAGPLASVLFSIGLLASALLAVPVLAATSAFVIAETFRWRAGWRGRDRRRWQFDVLLAGALALGVLVSLLNIPPLELLFVAGLVGGLATPVTLVFLVLLARDPKAMADKPVPRWIELLGWLAVLVVGTTALAFVAWEVLQVVGAR